MIHRPVFAVAALIALLSGLPRPAVAEVSSSTAPASTAAPLKTIIEVHSSVLCQTLHKGVQPTLTGLMKNDGLIEAANRAVAKMADDQVKQAAAGEQMDRLYLRDVASAMSHNLNTIAQLLGNAFPQGTTSTSASDDIHARLQSVASAQNDVLNLIEGFMATEDIGRAQDEFVGGHQSGANEVVGGPSVKGQVLPNPDMQGFRAEFHNADDPTTPLVDKAGLGSGLFHPPLRARDQAGTVPALIHLTRTRISDLEGSAGVAIVAAAKDCSAQ